MNAARCADVPISWLRLERYHLGEVDGAERARIGAHLAACAACAASYASLERDDAVALPPLPVAPVVRRERARGFGARGRGGAMVAGGLALAAAAVLAMGEGWRRRGVVEPGGPAGGGAVKGDAVVFSLVQNDGERIEGEGGIFRDGDRFKAIVTCPPAMKVVFDVVVYDEAGASFPMAPARVACGNGVPLPGAFRLSGSGEEKVCLFWGSGREPDRAALVEGGPGEQVLCKRLTGARVP